MQCLRLAVCSAREDCELKLRLVQGGHALFLLWWYRIVPHRSYVKGWKGRPEPLPQSGSRDGLARPI